MNNHSNFSKFPFLGKVIFFFIVSTIVYAVGAKILDRAIWPLWSFPFDKGKANILIVGDMFFDRQIRQVMEEKGGDYIFSCIDPLLKRADLVVGNLEGPITSKVSISVGTLVGSPDNFKFTFPTSTASLLFKHNIRVVGLGNNHINNFGQLGIAETENYLKKANVDFFGGAGESEPLHRLNINGVLLSFISYNQFGGQSELKVLDQIRNEKAAGRIVIVFAHWGEEYIDPSDQLRETARFFADGGASLIVGTHPHVVLPHEVIGKATVYYSLGNFIFDQYFNAFVRNGLTLMLSINEDQISIKEHPVVLNRDGTTCLAE